MTGLQYVIVTARDEADRLGVTLRALIEAFPDACVVVVDDGSRDASSTVARGAGAEVLRTGRRLGKGGAATLAARYVLERARERSDPAVVLICDADLGASAVGLVALCDAVEGDRADIAVGAFGRAQGGGVGAAVGFARWALARKVGRRLRAPISGQRALRTDVLATLLPFAPRFGMEMGMTIDAHRGGYRILEVELDLRHRATGRTLAGFAHRGRQLLDFVLVLRARRSRPDRP